jgi:hypothetical protein
MFGIAAAIFGRQRKTCVAGFSQLNPSSLAVAGGDASVRR